MSLNFFSENFTIDKTLVFEGHWPREESLAALSLKNVCLQTSKSPTIPGAPSNREHNDRPITLEKQTTKSTDCGQRDGGRDQRKRARGHEWDTLGLAEK